MTRPVLIVGARGLIRMAPIETLLTTPPRIVVTGTTRAERQRAAAYGETAARELAAYLRGELREWSVPAAPEGTDFQRAVWAAIARVPYGRVVTYGTLAAAVGRPRAVRAVAGACGRNPLPIRIPCHRIVAAHGPGGYTGGLACKFRLWDIEGIPTVDDKIPAHVLHFFTDGV